MPDSQLVGLCSGTFTAAVATSTSHPAVTDSDEDEDGADNFISTMRESTPQKPAALAYLEREAEVSDKSSGDESSSEEGSSDDQDVPFSDDDGAATRGSGDDNPDVNDEAESEGHAGGEDAFRQVDDEEDADELARLKARYVVAEGAQESGSEDQSEGHQAAGEKRVSREERKCLQRLRRERRRERKRQRQEKAGGMAAGPEDSQMDMFDDDQDGLGKDAEWSEPPTSDDETGEGRRMLARVEREHWSRTVGVEHSQHTLLHLESERSHMDVFIRNTNNSSQRKVAAPLFFTAAALCFVSRYSFCFIMQRGQVQVPMHSRPGLRWLWFPP